MIHLFLRNVHEVCEIAIITSHFHYQRVHNEVVRMLTHKEEMKCNIYHLCIYISFMYNFFGYREPRLAYDVHRNRRVVQTQIGLGKPKRTYIVFLDLRVHLFRFQWYA